MSDLLQHKLRIKEWEKAFLAKRGRVPSKADVKADADMWQAYKAYNDMKRADKSAASSDEKRNKGVTGNLSSVKREASFHKSPVSDVKLDLNLKPAHNQHLKKRHDLTETRPPMHQRAVDIQLTTNESDLSDEEYESLVAVPNAELGPTPQANGKVLSIFDLILSPPESSPLKRKHGVSPPSILGNRSPFKTPTKTAKRISFADLSPSKLANTPNLIPKNDVIATPGYLGKVNSKFQFEECKDSTVVTPTKAPSMASELFQASPSPLKSQRLLQKKLTDIFLEHQNLAMDEEFEAQKTLFENEFSANVASHAQNEEDTGDLRKRKNATTQKRTTRRWKIKPRTYGEDGTEDAFEGKNVHEEIEKIEQQQKSHLEQYMGDPEALSENDEEVVAKKAPPSTKINPVSNNYQRLKINDPRSKKFRQRMKRR